MKQDTILENLNEMKKQLEEAYPMFGEKERDADFYKTLRTLDGAYRIIRNREINKCEDCGDKMVCPKCSPVIEKTNSIIVRHKDTDYNGGYPNVLVITPMYTDAYGHSISCATLTGDNFFQPGNKTAGYTYMERGTIEKTAHILADLDVETWCRLFGFPKNRLVMARDMQLQLRKYLGLEII